ncbi:MAG: TlpA family protein disulfide reductase [Deltaproteobacteria bacterium]|nr:TlpA family protein disulfide reductase [Deltaproteobacteria bacterium]
MISLRRFAALSLALALVSIGRPGLAGQATNFTLRSLKGDFIRLSDYKDKVVYLAFWATWCKPCLTELKHLERFYKKYQRNGLVVLGISIDTPETRARVRTVVGRYKLTFPVAIDSESQVVNLYNKKRALPFSALFRKNQLHSKRTAFQVGDLPQIESEIRKALGL